MSFQLTACETEPQTDLCQVKKEMLVLVLGPEQSSMIPWCLCPLGTGHAMLRGDCFHSGPLLCCAVGIYETWPHFIAAPHWPGWGSQIWMAQVGSLSSFAMPASPGHHTSACGKQSYPAASPIAVSVVASPNSRSSSLPVEQFPQAWGKGSIQNSERKNFPCGLGWHLPTV